MGDFNKLLSQKGISITFWVLAALITICFYGYIDANGGVSIFQMIIYAVFIIILRIVFELINTKITRSDHK